MRAMRIDADFRPFLVDTSINRKILDSFLKSILTKDVLCKLSSQGNGSMTIN